jgi:hypothetical protein
VTAPSVPLPATIRRQQRTIGLMVELYCRQHGHKAAAGRLCANCGSLLDYALARLAHCPYGEEKPTCARCPIHCYKPEMRQRIQAVMRYSGPRMMLRHPIQSILHQIHEWLSRRSVKQPS